MDRELVNIEREKVFLLYGPSRQQTVSAKGSGLRLFYSVLILAGMPRRDRHLYDFTKKHEDTWALFPWSYGASIAAEQWCRLRGLEPVSGPSHYIEDKQWLCYVFYDKADAEALVNAMNGDGFISNRRAWLEIRRAGRRNLERPK